MCQGTTMERNVLPTNVVPRHYDVHYTEVDMSGWTFRGDLTVVLDVVRESPTIVLNCAEQEILSASIGDQASSDITYDKGEARATIAFKSPIATGKNVELKLKFSGMINDTMAGFYRSSYINQKTGQKEFLATTQMEATDCRKAFPCWDEPALKATFGVTITADEKYTVLSNMDIKSEKVEGGKKTTTFNDSPKMSTYLIAWTIGELEYIETHTPGTHMEKIPVRVYSTPGLSQQGKFSLDLAAQTLEFFSKTFGIPYPLPKLDMVAIPDFAAGAMENWGLVTYRVVDLLYDEKTSGANVKERVAEVVQHELAHQWFGNLVTMDWWEGLWLNEGFATWMSWYSANHFYPHWQVWDKYVTDNLQSALRLDGLRSSHPIEVPVQTAEDINQIFDAISYSKGSCVIRMISKTIGEDVFLAGIRRYLKKHAYGNTKTEDLWEALTEESGTDVSKIADLWTKRIGYPVVSVAGKQDEIEVSQNRFLTTGDVKPEEDETLFWVPLALTTFDSDGNSKVDTEAVLSTRTSSIKVGSGNVYKLNTGHSGIYRVNYTPEHLAKLGSIGSKLPPADRAGLVADAGALAVSGYGKTSGLLTLIEGWKSEKDFVVWTEVAGRIATIDAAWTFEDASVRDAFKTFKRELFSAPASAIGHTFTGNEDDFVEDQLKSLLFASAASAEDKKTVEAAKKMFESFAAGNKDAIHPNLRASVFKTALKTGGEAEYEVLLETFHDHTNGSDLRNTALRTLGYSTDPKLMQRTLSMVETDDVKSQDLMYPLVGLSTHKEGIQALFKYLTENYATIDKRVPNSVGSLKAAVVGIMTSGFTTVDKVEEIQRFFADKDTKAFNKRLEQVYDGIRGRSNWVARDREDVKNFLQKYM
ncbi:Aminopeptidase 2 [Taphrina deformans PYCC 5710]|uniref:Aminopeptidase n=1 Tax=Taphrina deformans (strain PYCC 5710 / ATCC 11124 / CBS 356.35 / IMI 108563 / JCM 9778 / NBRC 8474) TaxID=1097556 RepID=R4XFI7_TAPDE|nr:Aminopeptidase 2 [Taphrina deformans PYCC 5710]|eukprot:CCG82092.1 Aminopeptidase 2 [Taphrina deformans PYCC 5710]